MTDIMYRTGSHSNELNNIKNDLYLHQHSPIQKKEPEESVYSTDHNEIRQIIEVDHVEIISKGEEHKSNRELNDAR